MVMTGGIKGQVDTLQAENRSLARENDSLKMKLEWFVRELVVVGTARDKALAEVERLRTLESWKPDKKEGE